MTFARRISWLSAILIIIVFQTAAAQEVICNFDNLILDPESNWHGDASVPPVFIPDPFDPESGVELYHSSFTSADLSFENTLSHDLGWDMWSWSGWAYSNMTDTTTPGFGNQYSAITGAGMGTGPGNYAIAYCPALPGTSVTELPTIDLEATGNSFQGMHVTNTTYATLSMENGDGWAKKFGGVDGDDPDWLLLTIYGEDAGGDLLTNEVRTYMADYRDSDNNLDYIHKTWTYVDLTPLATASKLYFRLTSSDTGGFGMNTPAFIAVDNISTRQPTLWNNASGDGDRFNLANWAPQESPQPDSLLLINSGSASAASDVSINGGGLLTVDGATTSVSFPNLSVGNDTPGTLNIRNAAAVNVPGTIDIGPAGTIDVDSGNAQLTATVVNEGTISVQAGNSLLFLGAVSGSGNYTGAGTVAFGNQFSPGDSMATVDVAVEMFLNPGSTLVCEVGGQGECDQILVDQQLTITDSKMKLDWLPGENEDSMFGGPYTIATYVGTAISDAFELEDGLGNMLGNIGSAYVKPIDYSVDLGEDHYAIVVDFYGLVGGDVDLNGNVDGDDLATLGLTWSPSGTDKTWFDGDFDFDGDIDGDDLATLGLAWAPGGIVFDSGAVEVTAVPEPATVIMLLIAAAGLLLARKRQ